MRGATERTVAHLNMLVTTGRLAPGDRLAAERDLARSLGVARTTLRAALRVLARLGVVRAVRGIGTFVVDPVSPIGKAGMVTSASLLGFSRGTLIEMRRLLEPAGAALAAERATAEQSAVLAEEVSSLYAAVADPQLFLVHDARFHRAVGAASGNPIIASLVDLLTDACYEQARSLPPLASVDGLREAAATHRRIYHAIRGHDAARARAEMDAHLAPPPLAEHPRAVAAGQ